jgi:hypothetical protein
LWDVLVQEAEARIYASGCKVMVIRVRQWVIRIGEEHVYNMSLNELLFYHLFGAFSL